MRISDWSSDVCSSDLGAVAVGFDGAAFQSKINILPRTVEKHLRLVEGLDQAIVAAGLELAAPAGEAEIEQAEAVAVAQGDRAGVAQPGVVVFDREELDPRSEAHTSEFQSLMRISYAVLCLKKKHTKTNKDTLTK